MAPENRYKSSTTPIIDKGGADRRRTVDRLIEAELEVNEGQGYRLLSGPVFWTDDGEQMVTLVFEYLPAEESRVVVGQRWEHATDR